MSWLLAFAGFAALVILHELGHFAAAKAVGMRVERFSLFFGPLLVKLRRGETEYGIGTIPLGGYVKITGMNPAEDIPPEVLPRAYYRQPVWKRVVVILAGPAVNLLIAFLILGVIYLSQGLPTGAGKVGVVGPRQPAAGLLAPGDRILTADGVRLPSNGDAAVAALAVQVGHHTCAHGATVSGCPATTPVHLTVQRGTRVIAVAVTPRYDTSVQPFRPRLGIKFDQLILAQNVGQAADSSLDEMWNVASTTVSKVSQVFFSSAARKQVNSVVGAYEVTRQSFQFSTVNAFYILAIISLSLAVINLFPFLPLDGGHIFWALAEKVRGRAISFSVMERAGVVGFALILFVFLIGFSNDIHTLSNGGFHVR